jgi:hypothetical protein
MPFNSSLRTSDIIAESGRMDVVCAVDGWDCAVPNFASYILVDWFVKGSKSWGDGDVQNFILDNTLSPDDIYQCSYPI